MSALKHPLHTFAAVACLAAFLVGCSGSHHPVRPYGAQDARPGEALGLLGWDGDAAPTDPKAPHAIPGDVRFGLYGALAHPMESAGLGSCDNAIASMHDGYSPRDRIPNASAAYPAAFPVGLLPTNGNDTGLAVKTLSLSAWRAVGTPVTKAQPGDPAAFNGNGYMLLGLEADAVASRYRDDSAARGGPMMLLASPTVPGRGPNPACATYGSSVLILPDASPDSVHVNVSLRTQGEIKEALLCATVAIDGTHAGLWTQR